MGGGGGGITIFSVHVCPYFLKKVSTIWTLDKHGQKWKKNEQTWTMDKKNRDVPSLYY